MAVFLGVALYKGSVDFVESESMEQTRFLGTALISSEFASDGYVAELCDLLKKGAFGLKKRYEGLIFTIHSGREVYRKMQFTFGAEQVEKTIVFEFFDQIRDVIKLDLEDISVDHLVLSTSEKHTQVLALATPVRPLLRLVEGVEKFDLDPEKVIPEIGGLQCFVVGQIPLYASGNCFGLHTTPDGVFIYYLQNGLPYEVRFLKLCLGEIEVSVAKEVKAVELSATIEESENASGKVISEYEEDDDFFVVSSLTDEEIDHIAKEPEEQNEANKVDDESQVDLDKSAAIKRVLVQLKRTSFILPEIPTDILVTGVHAYDKELLSAMNVIGLKVYKDSKLDLKHAAAIGAATSFFQKELQSFNLRKGLLAYKGFFEKIVAPLNFCIFLLILVTVSMTLFLITEKNKAEKIQGNYTQFALDIKKQVDPLGEMKKYGAKIIDVNMHLDEMDKLLDFEANSDRYEEKHPIISCLRVWLEYERTLKRAFEKEKLVISSERGLTVVQGSNEVILKVNDARSVDLTEMESFLNLMLKSNNGYFSSAIHNSDKKDPKTGDVVFDFNAKKKYREDN